MFFYYIPFIVSMTDGRVNIDVPRYDQSTYWGRASHFFVTTNPLNLFATPAALDKSKDIVTRYRKVCKYSEATACSASYCQILRQYTQIVFWNFFIIEI